MIGKMSLSPMRFKTFIWPHNPKIYEIEFRRRVVTHKVPFGVYTLQSLGRTNRILRGEGEFCGAGAYDKFKELACLFYDDTPGILVHPLWQTSNAYLVDLTLRQEPTEDYVSYSFEFWECYDGYSAGAKESAVISGTVTAASNTAAAAGKWHTVAAGECMWSIASACGLSVQRLIALNPQVKNPNLIVPGEKLRIA